LRIGGEITEDVSNGDLKSPFVAHKDYLSPIIGYFIFKGTARGNSPFPADRMLMFGDPLDGKSYEIMRENEMIGTGNFFGW
jgi:hypothetical protein